MSKKQKGRPTDYNQQIADTICEQLSEGKSLRSICLSNDMPNKATVFRWLNKHEEFSDQYARAREEQAEVYADEITSIADECEDDAVKVAKARLQIDARKWTASKLKPKKYGDKVTNEHSGIDGKPMEVMWPLGQTPLDS